MAFELPPRAGVWVGFGVVIGLGLATATITSGLLDRRSPKQQQPHAPGPVAAQTDVLGRLSAGNAALAAGGCSDAIKAFDDVLRSADLAAGRLGRARAYVCLRRPDAARADLDAILDQHGSLRATESERASAQRLRGEVRLALHLYNGALEDLTAAAAHSSNDVRLHVDRGMALLGLDHPDQAEAEATEARRIDSNNIDALEFDVSLHVARGDRSGARVLLDAALIAHSEPRLLRRRAAILEDSGDYESAAQDLETLLKIDPTALADREHLTDNYLRMGQTEKALDLVEQALQANPNTLPWLTHHADIEARRKNWVAALHDYTAALALIPDERTFILGRGAVLVKLGRYHDAIADFDLVLSTHNNDVAALAGRAEAGMMLNDNESAAADCGLAAKLKPDFTEALRICAFANVRAGHFDEAKHFAARWRLADPAAVGALVAEAKAKDGLGDHAGARQDMTRAIGDNRREAQEIASFLTQIPPGSGSPPWGKAALPPEGDGTPSRDTGAAGPRDSDRRPGPRDPSRTLQ